MKKIFLPLLIFVIAGGAIFFVRIGHTEKPPSEPENTLEVKGIKEEPKYNIQTHIVADNDTFAKVMSDFGIDYSEMLAIVDSASSTYDMTSIKLGQPIRLAKDESGKELGEDKFLIGTAEPSLLAYYSGEVLGEKDLPMIL